MSKRMPKESVSEEPSFQIRPSFEQKFRPGAVKEIIHTVLNSSLAGKIYDAEKVTNWSKDISTNIKDKIKIMGYDRYVLIYLTLFIQLYGCRLLSKKVLKFRYL